LDDVIANLFEQKILNRICSHFANNNYKPVIEVFLNEMDVIEHCLLKNYTNDYLVLFERVLRKIFLNENDSIQSKKALSATSQEIFSAIKCLEAFKLNGDAVKLFKLKTLVDSKMLSIEYFQMNNLSDQNLFYLAKIEKLHLSSYNENLLKRKITADTFAQLYNLVELSLGDESIDIVPFMFKSLRNLKTLQLKLNSMNNIEEFSNLTALKNLIIDTARCNSVKSSLFGSLVNLEEIEWILFSLPCIWRDELSKMLFLKKVCIKECTWRSWGKRRILKIFVIYFFNFFH
jgi:hypothetical protein